MTEQGGPEEPQGAPGAAGDGAPGAAGDRAPAAGPGGAAAARDSGGGAEGDAGPLRLRVRRAPRYRAFVATGVVLGILLAAAVAFVTPPSGGYGRWALLGYLGVALAVVGAVVGGLVAVLVERRR